MGSEGTCPLGGLWYTCTAQTPMFFGCCTSNPCNGVGCPASDLRAAGLGTGAGPDFSSNDSSFFPNVRCAVGQWWTCAVQKPTFQGCCESNPCQGDGTGCPAGKLHPAAFSTVPILSGSSYIPPATSSTPARSSSTVISRSALPSVSSASANTVPSTLTKSLSSGATATAVSATSTATGLATPLATPSTTSNVPAIAGGAVGAISVVAILILLIYYLYRRRRRQSNDYGYSSQAAMASTGAVQDTAFIPNRDESIRPQHTYMNPESVGKYAPAPVHQKSQSPAVQEMSSGTIRIVQRSPGLGLRNSEISEMEDTSSRSSTGSDTNLHRRSELPDTPSMRGLADSPTLGEAGQRESLGGNQPDRREARGSYTSWQSYL